MQKILKKSGIIFLAILLHFEHSKVETGKVPTYLLIFDRELANDPYDMKVVVVVVWLDQT